jgi:hypothetical protein
MPPPELAVCRRLRTHAAGARRGSFYAIGGVAGQLIQRCCADCVRAVEEIGDALRYHDTFTPDSGAKPFGAANLQLFVAVGDLPVVDPDAASFYGAFTKNPVGVGFTAGDNGKQATYFARWASLKGDVGPWSGLCRTDRRGPGTCVPTYQQP